MERERARRCGAWCHSLCRLPRFAAPPHWQVHRRLVQAMLRDPRSHLRPLQVGPRCRRLRAHRLRDVDLRLGLVRSGVRFDGGVASLGS